VRRNITERASMSEATQYGEDALKDTDVAPEVDHA
jgi:hypothetical protein